jgi:3-phenylpropionate/trans-cinnamate dioxygenase ferredoxin reductase subunit
MAEYSYRYAIAGGGLTGGFAVEGIRKHDPNGTIALIGSEKHLPYDRPDLSKKLWFGKKKVEQIFPHDKDYYASNGVDAVLGTQVVGLDAARRVITDGRANTYRYDKLLLATGGFPRTLDLPGGDLPGICYFRYLDDYLKLREQAAEGRSAVVIGGGFIGSEIAAALTINKVQVTMVFPAAYLVHRVFPAALGRALTDLYVSRGIVVETNDAPASFEQAGDRFVTQTRNGKRIESDLVIAGVGILPAVKLAETAGLAVENGIAVNEFLQTSNPDVYAGGDAAVFPYQALGKRMRIEHWDNAVNQGRHAGENMAGAGAPFAYMPYFYSDLFEFGYEAVGDVDPRLETFADWRKENETGVIYYLEDGAVRGAMMCNVWDKVPDARELIRQGKKMTAEDLRGAIK